MKVLVIGGAGFLGSFVADELTSRGHDVSIFDLKFSPYLHSNQQMIVGDLLDMEAVSAAVQNHEAVYNFAGLSDLNASMRSPLKTIELNILGNTHVLEACVTHGVQRFLYASTVYVYSTKGSFYGVSKQCCEKIIEEYGREFSLSTTILRYGSVYGARANEQNRPYRLIKQALLTGKVTFQGNGSEEREYIHVQDAARLSVDLLAPEYGGQNLVLTGVERHSYQNLLKIVQEILGDQIQIEYLQQKYKGHYHLTPYSFSPLPGKKIVANPYVDLGQGLLLTIQDIHRELKAKNQDTIFDFSAPEIQ